MYICYVDESGDGSLNPSASKHYMLTGVAMLDTEWLKLRKDFEKLYDKYLGSVVGDREIHMTELRARKGKLYRGMDEQKSLDFQADIYRTICSYRKDSIVAFTAIANKANWFSKNPTLTGDDLYVHMFEQISSRFDLFLKRIHPTSNQKGMFVTDENNKSITKALKAFHGRSLIQGNQWTSIKNIIETLFFLPSHESPGIQLADIFSYSVWRYIESNDSKGIDKIFQYFDREPFSSDRYQGKWHGVKTFDLDQIELKRVRCRWPTSVRQTFRP